MQAARHKTTETAPSCRSKPRLSASNAAAASFSRASTFGWRRAKRFSSQGRMAPGKSTLLRAFAGFLPLAAGASPSRLKRRRAAAELCHYIGHADALKPALTLAENLAFYSALLGGRRHRARARASRLDGDRRSAGRPIFGRAETPRGSGAARRDRSGRIWLLDEPLTALDAKSQIVRRRTDAGASCRRRLHYRRDPCALAGRGARSDAWPRRMTAEPAQPDPRRSARC